MINSKFIWVLLLVGNLSGIRAKPATVIWTTITASTTTTTAAPQIQNCHPAPNTASDQYMIGYGSLMQNASKSRTAPNTGPSLPVIIQGFSRQWNAQGVSISYSTTFLGIIADPNASFNGVIFQLPGGGNMTQTVRNYDARETWYCRQIVPSQNVLPMLPGQTIDMSAQYWIYVNIPQYTAPPNAQYPIVESYVDIFISGCLELETQYNISQFAVSCVNSTVGWEAPWVNDRIYPRRAFIYQTNAAKIDAVLAAGVPKAYNAITIEGLGNTRLESKSGYLFAQRTTVCLLVALLCFMNASHF